MRFTATSQKTAVVFVFASFYMRLNVNSIGKSHVLKLQMALKKSVSETGALAYKFRITAFLRRMLLLCVFTATAQKTAVVFVFASFPMRLNANGIEKSHVLKLQMESKKACF